MGPSLCLRDKILSESHNPTFSEASLKRLTEQRPNLTIRLPRAGLHDKPCRPSPGQKDRVGRRLRLRTDGREVELDQLLRLVPVALLDASPQEGHQLAALQQEVVQTL